MDREKEKIIEVSHLVKAFESKKAVDTISFHVNRGELFGFLGVNGAGKSTTINMLCTMYEQDQGSISICGLDSKKEKKKIQKKIGVVFQNNTLDERLTIRDNLISRGVLYEKNWKRTNENMNQVALHLGIEDLLMRKFSELSGGQKRRCEIARAIMNEPEILFLDEPTTGLDPQSRKIVWDSIDWLRKEEGLTVFLTTHYMEEAAKADQIGVMDAGRLVANAKPYQLKQEFARDSMKLIPINQEAREQIGSFLKEMGHPFLNSSHQISVTLNQTIDAIPLLGRLKEKVASFEVIQGTMDDVFLNITGRQLEHE